MTAAAQKLLEQVLALLPDEQTQVLEGLSAHLEQGPDLHPAWNGEIRRRIAAAENSELETIPMDVAHDRVRRMFREPRLTTRAFVR